MHGSLPDNLQQDMQTAIDVLDGEYSKENLESILKTCSGTSIAQQLIFKCYKKQKDYNEKRMD